jgi:hypothetical protein
MANTMENTRSLRMDMSSVIARQPYDCTPAGKMKDESVSVMFRLIRLGYSGFNHVCIQREPCLYSTKATCAV